EITGLGPIPVSTARELLGDSILKLVITKGVDVLHVTHLGRGPNAAQRVAPTHPPRRVRPAVQTPPCPQDQRRLGARRRHRQTTDGSARRPSPPEEPTQARV
ncbi:MAG TPA: hypothetical protein VKJ07_23805, partial [Mycobacteriales bacterium]|nr:hypothetical protein [Mycobacteriales bacterium]